MAKGHLMDTGKASAVGEGGRVIRELLVVDDNPADVRLTVEALNKSRSPYHVNIVVDGEAALAFLQRQGPYTNAPRPALILLDLNLPRMDGHEVLAAIQVDPELRRIPVVIVSTSSSECDIRRAYAGGATRYLIKPMSWDGYVQLAETVATVESWRTHP